MNYAQQIKHPNWQKKRLEVMELHDFKCQSCGNKDETLNVHHPFYNRGAMIWEYETNELQCLCQPCHKNIHSIDESIKKSLACLSPQDKIRVLGLSDALNGLDLQLRNYNYLRGYMGGFPGDTMTFFSMMLEKYGEWPRS